MVLVRLLPPRRPTGFSLIEMLMVISVAMLLMSLAAPALIDLAPTRKGAIREVRLMLEKARLTARRENRVSYVAFADDSPDSSDDCFRRYAIFRAEDELDRDSGNLLDLPLVQVTPWERLPRGFLFAAGADFEAMPGHTFQTILDSPYRRDFAFVNSDGGGGRSLQLPFLAFHPSGRVEVPPSVDAGLLHCGIAQGYCEADGSRVLTARQRGRLSPGDFAQGECLAINRFTGKARLITD